MYPIVAETLILTLGEASGSAWNAVVEAAWLRAILAVANEMLAGARELEEADAAPTSRTFAPPSSQQ
jgi:hemoglobin-like flavoprotein